MSHTRSARSSGNAPGAGSSHLGYAFAIDGGFFTVPRGGFYNLDGEWDVENEGVAPDIEVVQTPRDVIEGRDPQLERAIEEAMQRLPEENLIFPEPAPPTPAPREQQ